MTKGALALLIHGGTDNWAPERWKARFTSELGDRAVISVAQDRFDPRAVHYAAVWKPTTGELAAFPELKVIFNLGAGVDAVLNDPALPPQSLAKALDLPVSEFFEFDEKVASEERRQLEFQLRDLARSLSDRDLSIAVAQIKAFSSAK